MRRFIPLLSVALLAACSTPAEEPQPPHYVALGDSYAAMGSTTLPLLSLIHISEPTSKAEISYAVFCL